MPRMSRVSKNNTKVISKNGNTSVILHNTVVVEFDCEFIILRTGGWKTATTKARMNQASNEFGLGYRVDQKDGKWFVSSNGETIPFSEDELKIERFPRMVA